MNRVTYQITIENTIHKTTQFELWTWNGGLDKNGNKILRNFHLYTSDTMLKLDSNNKVVGGYSFIFNSVNALTVKAI